MSSNSEFDIGCEVACSDGACGVLSRVVVDPVAQVVTHLVVEPRHGRPQGHLVPIDYVVSSDERIELRCTQAQLAEFERAEEDGFIPAPHDVLGYGSGDALVLPYFRLILSSRLRPRPHDSVERHDWVPLGEVDVRRGESVHATDGDLGRVAGLVINPEDHHVTHILLQEGHLSAHKEVAIPISAVKRVGDVIRLTLSRDEVRDLPAVDTHHPLG